MCLGFLLEMRERAQRLGTEELRAILWMCRNPTRQAYVALFPPSSPFLSSSLSICVHPLSKASLLSLLFFCSAPWLPCGHSVRCICLSPSAICFPDREWNWRRALAKQHACTHLQIHVCVCTDTCKLASTHVQRWKCVSVNAYRAWKKTDVKISSLGLDGKWAVKENRWLPGSNCARVSPLL